MENISRIKQGSIDLTVGSPTKKIVLFTLPLILGNVFQLFYSWTDAIVLGNVKHNAVQFSALSAAMPVINLLLTVVLGFLAGAAVVLGQKYGKGDYTGFRKGFSTLLMSMAVLAVAVGALGFALARPLLKLINVDAVYLDYSVSYLRYYFAGLIFMTAYNTLAQVLRCLGNSLVPLIALIICVTLNVGFDLLFVLSADMGIEGVALGTLLAQFCSAAIMMTYITLRVPLLKIKRKDFIFDKTLFVSMVRLGIPSTIQNICACAGFMVINAMVNGDGREFTTAFGLGNRIDEILSQINNSFGIAMTGYAAQNKGKGDIARIKKGYKSTMIIMTVTVVVLAAVIYVFRDAILSVFIDMDVNDPDIDLHKVKDIAFYFLGVYLPSFVLLCWMTATSSLIRGTGAAKLAMTVNICSFAVRVTAALILNSVSVYGVFYASPIGWLAGAAWALTLYFRGRWKKTQAV